MLGATTPPSMDERAGFDAYNVSGSIASTPDPRRRAQFGGGQAINANNPPYPSWIYRQSAVLPYRLRGGALEVLLISSRGGKRWVLPKGIVEPGMTPAASATKEALEEAGIEGDAASEPLGTYRYEKWGGTCEVTVYPFRVGEEHEQWPEAGSRRRRWLSLRKAKRRVDIEGLHSLIARLPRVLEGAQEMAPAAQQLPARLVFLLRHAKSSWDEPGLADFDRPLAPRGERACEAMQRYIELGDIHPQLVLCSSAVRAAQTLDRVKAALGEDAEVKHYRGLYLAGPQAMLNRLRRTAAGVRNVMLVAHNPGMHTLALRLAGAGAESDLARMRTKFPTGALATLVFPGKSWADLDTGSCELHSFVVPREIGEPPGKRKRDGANR